MLKRWLREPLIHFLLIGGLLFVFYGLLNDSAKNNDNHIVITIADIDHLKALWKKKWQRNPTQVELNGLIEQQIREEVMYREALALGLDQNDTIVRRRLTQKLEFITADLATHAEPSDAELAEFLQAHIETFTTPSEISFEHVYLNTDKRGEEAQQDAQRLLNELKNSSVNVDINIVSDPFMLGQQYDLVTEQEVSRLFGNRFASELFTLPIGSWQGPVESGYGLHLVKIDIKTASSEQELDKVRDKVRTKWLAQQRREMDQAFYENLRKRYEITIEDSSAKDTIASTIQ